MVRMQSALDVVVGLLDLESIEVNLFRGNSPDASAQRVFGGQVAGQALVAAARTVDQPWPCHSLHAYFLRPGDPSVPILYEVDRIRDGRSFITRRVVAIQHGKAIFNLAASFHKDEDGFEHQAQMPDVPEPESLPDWHEVWASRRELIGDRIDDERSIDIRYVTAPPVDRDRPHPPRQTVWLRANGKLPSDPVLHTCLLTYASDMTLLDTTLMPHAAGPMHPDVMMASLDHAMWFHRPLRADEWFLYTQETPSANKGVGLARGLVFSRGGDLVASVMQEGLIRPVR